jgi:hypothetical protein
MHNDTIFSPRLVQRVMGGVLFLRFMFCRLIFWVLGLAQDRARVRKAQFFSLADALSPITWISILLGLKSFFFFRRSLALDLLFLSLP